MEVTRGGEHIATLGPGDIFGEAGVLNDAVRNATVTASSPLKLIIMGHFEVQRLRKNAPELYARIERAGRGTQRVAVDLQAGTCGLRQSGGP